MIFTIDEVEFETEDDRHYQWKLNAPEQILILIDQKQCKLLDYCGRANENESEYGELTNIIEESSWRELADGVWVVSGQPYHFRCEHDGDYDSEWRQEGKPRRLTKEEWECFRDEDQMWGMEWRSPAPVDTTVAAPTPKVGTCDGDLDFWQFDLHIADCYHVTRTEDDTRQNITF